MASLGMVLPPATPLTPVGCLLGPRNPPRPALKLPAPREAPTEPAEGASENSALAS